VRPSGRLRVIAGEVGGLRLAAPKGDRTRPTADRVKESLFSSLGSAIEGASVLDGYAGSGALAIEALSRGARGAVVVDRAAAARSVMRANLATTGMTDRASVLGGALESVLAAEPPPEAPFDVVFLDPPYDEPAVALERVLALLADPEWTAAHARIVVERAVGSEGLTPPPGWDATWTRTVGSTLVSVLARPVP